MLRFIETFSEKYPKTSSLLGGIAVATLFASFVFWVVQREFDQQERIRTIWESKE